MSYPSNENQEKYHTMFYENTCLPKKKNTNVQLLLPKLFLEMKLRMSRFNTISSLEKAYIVILYIPFCFSYKTLVHLL